MRISYLGNWSPYAYSTEKLVKKALEKLGHQIFQIDEQDYNLEKIKQPKPDLFLFHKGTRYGKNIDNILEFLNKLTCKKVFWYFDMIEGEREKFIQSVAPFVDYGFLTDESWLKRRNYTNLFTLRQGCDGEDTELGQYRKEYNYDVVFVGSIYDQRARFVEGLKYAYGDRFKVFTNVWGKDFKDLCASAKVIASPRYPMDDYYWSNRIYLTLGNGGFLIFPKLYALKDEFKDGKHYISYNSGKELKEKIDYYLKNEQERKKIQMAGYRHTIKYHTYEKRCQILLNKL